MGINIQSDLVCHISIRGVLLKYISHVSHIIALYYIGNIIVMVPISNI